MKLAGTISGCVVFAGLLAGCVIEPFSSPMPVPARYWAPVPAPETQPGAVAQPANHTGPVVPNVVATRPVATQPAPIEPAMRDQIGRAVWERITKRYPASKDAARQSYLVLVGSVVALKAPPMEQEPDFVLLETDRLLSGAIAPNTIFVSKGLLHQMEDESELAGVLAREITNLATDRVFQAAGLTVAAHPKKEPPTNPAPAPASRPATGPATRAMSEKPASAPVSRTVVTGALPTELEPSVARIARMLTGEGMGAELEQKADVEGARLAAEAKYAPDGYLRLLTRIDPGSPGTPQWDRIKALDSAASLLAKAHPHADVRLPARFEEAVGKRQ